MKKKSIITLLLSALAMGVSAQTTLSNSEVNNQWRAKTISVKNGGQTPHVIALLHAFHEALPTWVVSQVLKQADTPAPGTRVSGTASIWDDGEDDYRILIDRRNGYVDLASQTDIDQMSACVWRKNNGHRIFAVSLYEQHDPITKLLCWYDYDPATETMKPEKSPLDDFKPSCNGYDAISWTLPMKGTDFEIHEYYNVLPNPITHVYKWDREQFKADVAKINMFEYFPSVGSTHYAMLRPGDWTHYALVDLTGEGNPVFMLGRLKDGKVMERVMMAQFKGDICQIAESSADFGYISAFSLPPHKDNKRVAVVYRDQPGGLWYTILTGCYVQFTLSDLPNFAKASNENERMVSVEEGYGGPDETTDILNQLGEDIYLGDRIKWQPFEVIAEILE